MGMVVRTNTMANNAFRQLGMNNSALSKSLEKLSSGYRINRAGDDAAGLAISEKMKAQITGLEAASTNAEDGISLVQTAEGALTEVHDMLNRMVELSTKAANGIYTQEQRDAYKAEIDQLNEEITRISETTKFNDQTLLNGDLGGGAGMKVNFGTNEFIISMANQKADGTNDTSITMKVDENTTGIKVEIGANAALTVTFGTQAKTTYTSSDIENAIQKAVEEALAQAKASATDVNIGAGSAVTAGNLGNTWGDAQKTAANLNSIKFNGGDMTFAAGTDNTKVADANGTATATGAAGAGSLALQVGASSSTNDTITVTIGKMDAATLGVTAVDISSTSAASASINTINEAIQKVSDQRAELGAIQNRLEHTVNNLDTTAENLDAANSRIRDTDMAKEMMEYTKMSVLVQSAQAMLAQANQQPQAILQLLQ